MARRVRGAAALIAALFALGANDPGAAEEATFTPLAAHFFDEGEPPPTGPDTFQVWETSRGTVGRSSSFRWSGAWSVEIRDQPGDGDFPELQGHFELQRTGRLFAHFALLVTDPSETFNVALAGPRGFRLGEDGLAFWLENRGGTLVHVSDGIPKRLLALEPFTWYVFDLLYDIEAGRYDLAVYRESESEPLLARAGQPNAANAPGSGVDTFSFIGDRGDDTSRVVYYVDDVVIGADEALEPPPFVAPGRRRLFVETEGAHRRIAARQFLCLPVVGPEDLGLEPGSVGPGDVALFARPVPEASPGREEPPLAGVARDWRRACSLLARDEVEGARKALAGARELLPDSRLLRLTALLAAGRAGQTEGLVDAIDAMERDWGADPRFTVARSMALVAAGRVDEAIEGLRPYLDGIEERGSRSRTDFVLELVGEQLYYARVVAGRYEEALAMARRFASRNPARWLEREGDLLLLSGSPAEAKDAYQGAREAGNGERSLLLREADAAYLLGDVEAERSLRESIYGSLAIMTP